VRRLVSSGSTFERDIGFSRAVRVGDTVYVSATAAIWPDGHVDPDAGVQAARCLEIIAAALAEAGAALSDVVRTRVSWSIARTSTPSPRLTAGRLARYGRRRGSSWSAASSTRVGWWRSRLMRWWAVHEPRACRAATPGVGLSRGAIRC
jgi:hypothetical protein